ncbi:tudor domain-containing protein [Paraphysoderma sedebokerense]|nr:tudor domain-containing protein [Paraphysoderma sedebokerense]
MATLQSSGKPLQRGFVKQVLSGDCIILRSRSLNNAPPKERTISLAFIEVPRFGSLKKGTSDEPFAYLAREHLRKVLVGREVQFRVEFTVPSTSREYCTVFFKSPSGEVLNAAVYLVKEGLAKVRADKGKDKEERGEEYEQLLVAETTAKEEEKGLHGPKEAGIRVTKANLDDDARTFLEKYKGQQMDAIVEQIRDGSTLRVSILLPETNPPVYQYITVLLSGIKAPTLRTGIEGQDDLIEPFAEDAKNYVEVRLLQREVKVVLEGLASSNNFVASVLHPAGNIAELLVKEGMAKVVDWSAAMVTGGPTKLRAAEKFAKEKRLRLWQNFVAKNKNINEPEFTGTVTKIISGDLIMVRSNTTNVERKISLSSIRQPKAKDPKEAGYNFQAREFLRQRLIGKTVTVHIDYVKPATEGFEAREYATVKLGESAISELLVVRGLAGVIRHRKDDDDRASNYDQLLTAEAKAQADGKGIFSTKEPPVYRISDASETAPKAKQFLPFLKRQGRISAVVEHISNASRFRLYIPKESARLTFVLSGIRAPKVARNPNEKSDPFGVEALEFVSDRAYQRDVEIEVEATDKVGGFIGTMIVGGSQNVAVLLLEQGLATVHEYSAEQTPYTNELFAAQRKAKIDMKGVWLNYEESKEETPVNGSQTSTYVPVPNIKDVVISEYLTGNSFYVQFVKEAMKLESMMSEFAQHHSGVQPANVNFKVNELCSAQFSEDNQWYRAKIRRVVPDSKSYEVLYIDYGNSEVLPARRIRALPPNFAQLPSQAHEAKLTYVRAPGIEDSYGLESRDRLRALTMGKQLLANVDSTQPTLSLTLFDPSHAVKSAASPLGYTIESSINAEMLLDGAATVEKSWKRVKGELVEKLKGCMKEAKEGRHMMWEYGDIEDDEDDSFVPRR